MNRLSLINSIYTDEVNKISIVNNEIKSNLMYNDPVKGQIDITGEDSKYRPIHISELANKLKDRDWNIAKRLYISSITEEDGRDILRLKIKEGTDSIDVINTEDENTGILFCNPEEIPVNEINDFKEEFKDILDNMKENEIYLYSSSKKVIDVLNNTMTLDIIKYNSDTYTNTINLKELINYSSFLKVSGKIDLSVQYVKNGKIINYDTTFEGFKYSGNSSSLTLESNNFIEEIGNDIVIEYVDNIIRIIPILNDISECIISNCTVTYGNIG